MVTKWLKSTFIKKCRPGIIFLHSLDSDLPHDGMLMSRHLDTFAKAFPNKFAVPSRVYVVSTSKPASTLPSETLSQRLSQLETIVGGLNGNGNHKWHASMFPGVFKGQPETAWSAVLLLFKGIAETEAKEFPAFPKPTLKRTPPNFLPGYIILRDLADFLFEEFRKEGTSGDLDAIITLGRTALEFIPSKHPRRHSILINLADLLYERFQKEDTAVDLDEIITLRQAASDLMPPDDTETLAVLLQLDNCLYQRFGRKNVLVDLEDIISLRRVVLEYTPQNRCKPLLSLADALYEKYQALGSVNDIEEALSLARTASQLDPPGHPDFALSQEHLARYLKAKVRKGAALAHVRGVKAGPSSSSSSDVEQLIDKAVSEYLENIPLRLLHTPTGFLCNRDAQLSKFKDSPQYKQILLSASSLNRLQLQTEINNVVTNFFRIAMLSHRWGSGEPLLRNVDGKNIYNLGCTGGLAKLQSFCVHALEHNLQWAWSDTCCIDKDSSAELQEAIGSMFSWYRRSSLTLVHLSDISDAGSLVDSVWFKRGWTLQELLASQAILFYTRGWSLYMNCDVGNHKADPAVLGELQKATGIAEKHLRDFSPGTDDARSRLHWASGRSTTRVEDVAYSLLGIFDIHLPILYGESAEYALGRLLAEIISRSGDVSVLDWVGKASSFNSCFPADLVPYQTVPHIQLITSDLARRDDLDLEKAHKLYSNLARLPRAGVVNRRLTLPSTVHQVTVVKLRSPSTSPSCYTYEIHASHLLPLEVTLSVTLDEGVDRYLLARPWHPQPLQTQAGSDDDAVWELLEQLKQPFNALLLKRLLHNEYRRIASDCAITACVQDLAGVLDSEVLVLGIV
ncbi:hypothetical protein BKA82DRAFT_742944 [Pisolithus tinctorius]|uniref:Heterokaryon incompatibility domain-containing protein n=1 Tax=Pisolithus tinctorius Marx 270 TaxID=870435 RepID=A0A0C3P0U9_PISTI|nr:hypothetical protein BKA82DRAFT_742944 [Pisolithus tinctorius]KIO01126.1 hypothetical protein M404DRAFT_742944 [Pisolithus tinctorius Marx 270]